jgi:hypothetical protein
MLGFKSSAQAMLRSGMRFVLRFLCKVYSIRLFFPEPLRIPFSRTFIITAPSFKCKLTFFPMYDLALLAPKFSIVFSPLVFLVSYCVPALLADGYFFASYKNVEFYIFAFASVFPRVFTMLHFSYL